MAVRRQHADVIAGRARVNRRTKELIPVLVPGDVAIIDHEDVDRVAAEGLIESGIVAVVNAKRSMSGRYPNVGPLLIAAAGIVILDDAGPAVMEIPEHSRVRIDGSALIVDDATVATGERQDLASLEASYEASKRAMGEELERFATNTLEYMQRERHLLLDSPELPVLRTVFDRRHVLVVVRGHDYKNDLAHLRSYVDEMRPVLVGVDGGADAIREVGMHPDLIIGDFDSVSEEALRSGAELVVHAYPGGKAPGAERLDQLGVDYVTLPSAGTSEDVALLLAYEKGAELIVAVGTHNSMVDFLDKGRAGMASTFLTRLKVGPILLDAKGVSRLYQGRIRKRDLTFFLLAAMLCFVVIFVMVTPSVFIEGLWLIVRDQWDSLFR